MGDRVIPDELVHWLQNSSVFTVYGGLNPGVLIVSGIFT